MVKEHMNFDLVDITEMYSDCSTYYDVVFEKNATVKDLLNYVLKNPQHGVFKIVKEITCFPNVISKCEFHYGKITNGQIPTSILNKKIKKARANGGWGRMDYEIEIYN